MRLHTPISVLTGVLIHRVGCFFPRLDGLGHLVSNADHRITTDFRGNTLGATPTTPR